MKIMRFRIGGLALAMLMFVSALILYLTPVSTYAYTNSNMPSGYRPITSQDVGKVFGVELETTIFFSSQYTSNPISYFADIRLTDNLNREYYIGSFDYGEERPYTYGYAVYDEWTESPLRHYYKELYFFDVMAGVGSWDVVEDPNPHYIVPNGYKLDLYYSPSNYSLIWVKDKGGGVLHYSVPFVDIEGVTYGSDNKLPLSLPEPVYEGRYFVGWYYDINYKTRAYEGESIPIKYIRFDGINDFVVLYGRWSVNYSDVWEDEYRNIWTQEGYDKGFTNGHGIGYQEGYAEAMEMFGSQEGGLYWLRNIATTIGAMLALEVFPSISIGLLVFIPFAFGLLFWFLKLLKGGGD